MNARFWIYWNCDWVKITLTPARPRVELSGGHRTEEGYAQYHELYELVDGGVKRECDSYERDCDGPMEHHSESFCPFNELRTPYEVDPYFPENPYDRPKWEKISSHQRDYYAEMAGY